MKKLSILVLLMFSLFSLLACERVKKAEEPPLTGTPEGKSELTPKKEEEGAAPSMSVANVVLKAGSSAPVTLAVATARTPEERSQGLQGRENLGENHGMWFIFENDVQDPFWMKHTPIPLDIIFVGSDYKIVDLIENAVPNSETLLVPQALYRYALEVNAGSVRAHGLAVGDSVEFRLGPP